MRYGSQGSPALGGPARGAARANSTGARRKLEIASVAPLVRLQGLPRWLLPLTMGVLLLAGLLIPFAWAGVFLLMLATFLGWLVALSWPVLAPGAKVLRVAVVGAVFLGAVWRLSGRM